MGKTNSFIPCGNFLQEFGKKGFPNIFFFCGCSVTGLLVGEGFGWGLFLGGGTFGRTEFKRGGKFSGFLVGVGGKKGWIGLVLFYR